MHIKSSLSCSVLVSFLLTLALPLLALAQGEGPVVQARAVAQHPTAAQGDRLVIAVELDHAPTYHTWPSAETSLGGDLDTFAIRTEFLLLSAPAWVTLDGVQYPPTHPDKVANPDGSGIPLVVPLFSGRAIGYLRLAVSPDAPIGEHTFTVGVNFQACDDKQCQMPEEQTHSVKVTIAAAGTEPSAASTEPALFTAFDASKWGSTPAAQVDAPPPSPPAPDPAPATNNTTPAPTPAVPAPVIAGGASLFGFNLGSSFLLVALASALGGFILNLTPCVLPVIPIKIMTLTQHASSRRHAMILGLWMAFGVVTFWTIIGIPMALISRQLDPSQFIFGIWWVCMLIGLIIALMGLGIMGLFTLNLPQAVYMVDAKADSPFGSFMFGVLTAILGLPCFGFVAGGLLAAAATMPAYLVMTIFIGMGVGMAAPYLVLSAYPQLLKFIPRTGPASELVKQVMGILLIAAAAFFIAASIQTLISDYPYLAGSMTWWATGFFIAIAGIWMTVRTFQITKRPIPRLIFPVLAIAMTLGIGLFANGRFAQDRKDYTARQAALATSGPSGQVPAGVWLHYTPELLATVRESGRPVFLDFTASWCINCKAIKAAILDPEPLATIFKDRGVVLMEVDCSSRNSAGSKLLKELNRTGVPTWAIFGPGKAEPIFVGVDTPTVNTVVQSLNLAGVPDAAADSTAIAPSNAGSHGQHWLQYTPEVFAAARQSGHHVLVNFSAQWCNISGEISTAMLKLESQTGIFKERGVILINADCSSRNSAGSNLRKQHDLPSGLGWAIFSPGQKEPVFREMETPSLSTVLTLFEQVGVPPTTSDTLSATAGPAIIPIRSSTNP